MAKSSAEQIKTGVTKLTADQRKKLLGETPASKARGKPLTDEQVQAEMIEEAYSTGSKDLSFDDWVQMKLPTVDKNA